MRRAIARRVVARHAHHLREESGLALEFARDEICDVAFTVGGVHACVSKLVRKSWKARAASPASAAVIVSSGWWLMPPLPQRTNSMPICVTAAITIASWPAPLGRR